MRRRTESEETVGRDRRRRRQERREHERRIQNIQRNINEVTRRPERFQIQNLGDEFGIWVVNPETNILINFQDRYVFDFNHGNRIEFDDLDLDAIFET